MACHSALSKNYLSHLHHTIYAHARQIRKCKCRKYAAKNLLKLLVSKQNDLRAFENF